MSDNLVEMTWTARCKPGTVWVARPSLFFLILFLLIVAGWGASVGWAISKSTAEWTYAKPVELTADERAASLRVQKTFPTTFRIRIASKEGFEKEKMAATTQAFARFGETSCEIVIPEGWEILFAPGNSMAVWKRQDNGDTLAHEILHCLRGDWHPNPIKATGK